jgi:hypothetical protein
MTKSECSWKAGHVTNCCKRPISKINKIFFQLKESSVAAVIYRTLIILKSRTNITVCIDSIKLLDCQEALGMENGAILDGQITASSQWDGNHAPFQGRLYFQASGRKQGSWSAAQNNSKQ